MFETMSRGRRLVDLALQSNKMEACEAEESNSKIPDGINIRISNNGSNHLSDISEYLPEASSEEKVFCFLRTVNETQNIATLRKFEESDAIILEQPSISNEENMYDLQQQVAGKQDNASHFEFNDKNDKETEIEKCNNLSDSYYISYLDNVWSASSSDQQKKLHQNEHIFSRDKENGHNSPTRIKILDYKIFLPPNTILTPDLTNNTADDLESKKLHVSTSTICSGSEEDIDDSIADPDFELESQDSKLSSCSKSAIIEEALVPEVKQDHLLREDICKPEVIPYSSGKNLCPFCFEDVGHFSRHLLRKHYDEEEVRKISQMKSNSNDKRKAIVALRKKGNFILMKEKDELHPVRHRKGSDKTQDYYPCATCLGYYKKTYLWRHRKLCNASLKKTHGSKIQHLTEAQTFLASTGLLGNYFDRSRLKSEVFPIMRADEISLTAKSDPLICLYGESYLNKHKRMQMNVVVSNRIRELARLTIALQKITTIKQSIDFLKPELYENVVAACKIISGYNTESKTFKASSLALHMGTNLKFLCDVARKAVLTQNPLFLTLDENDKKEKLRQILEFRDLIKNHWCNDISSIANKALSERKIEKPKLVPLTADIKCFNKYIMNITSEAYEKLEKREDLLNNYKTLAEGTLCLVLVFNRKRIGEIQFLHIETYNQNFFSLNQDEFLNCLTELEKCMSSYFKRIVVFGKGNKPVPILFTKQMQKYIQLLIKIREETDIVPKTNKYLFANPCSTQRWMNGSHIMRKFAKQCGAKKPELLTSTRFRKQIATILQLMNLQNDEMEQIARFMGHTDKTHKEFYRLTDDCYQTAKVAKVLLLLNAGRGSEFKGKNLNEIEVGEELIEYDGDDDLGPEDDSDHNDLTDIDLKCKTSNGTESIQEAALFIEREIALSDKDSITSSQKTSLVKPNKKNRVRWGTEEKKLVLNFFKKNINNKLAPRKNECLDFIRKNNNLFKECDWVRIKTFVYNTYRLK